MLLVHTILGIWLVIVLHELGHCAVALAQGYRFLFITVGPLRLETAPRGPRLRLNRSLALAGGVCATVPERIPLERLRLTQQRVVLAGPITNLICGPLLLVVGLRLGSAFCFASGAASLGVGVAALIPSRQGVMLSDGLVWRILRRGGPAAEYHLAKIALAMVILSPTPPADWPAQALELLIHNLREHPAAPGQPEWQSQLSDRALLYYHYSDRGDTDQAGVVLATASGADELRSAAKLRSQAAVAHELLRAFHLAWVEHDALGARAALDAVARRRALAPADWRRSQAAVLVAEGDLPAARAALGQKVRVTEFTVAGTGLGALEQRWLDELSAACDYR